MAKSAPSVELVIHVGPHKTASTSIQLFLARNFSACASLGFYIPPSPEPMGRGTMHHLASKINRHNMNNIEFVDGLPNYRQELESWFTAARDAGLSKVLVSAEAFSQCDARAWKELNQLLTHATAAAKVTISSVTLLWTERNPASRIASMRGQTYVEGSAVSEKELEKALTARIDRDWKNVQSAPRYFDFPTIIDSFRFENNEGTSAGFLQRWCVHVFGEKILSAVEPNEFDIRVNEGVSESDIELFKAFNQVNVPTSIKEYRPFLLPTKTQEEENARLRWRAFRAAILARRDLQVQLDELEKAFDEQVAERNSRLVRLALSMRKVGRKILRRT